MLDPTRWDHCHGRDGVVVQHSRPVGVDDEGSKAVSLADGHVAVAREPRGSKEEKRGHRRVMAGIPRDGMGMGRTEMFRRRMKAESGPARGRRLSDGGCLTKIEEGVASMACGSSLSSEGWIALCHCALGPCVSYGDFHPFRGSRASKTILVMTSSAEKGVEKQCQKCYIWSATKFQLRLRSREEAALAGKLVLDDDTITLT